MGKKSKNQITPVGVNISTLVLVNNYCDEYLGWHMQYIFSQALC